MVAGSTRRAAGVEEPAQRGVWGPRGWGEQVRSTPLPRRVGVTCEALVRRHR